MSVNNYLIEGEDYVSVQCTIKGYWSFIIQ